MQIRCWRLAIVVAGKVFRLFGSLSLVETALRLEGYRTEDSYEEGDYRFTLVTEVVGLLPKESMLRGIYSLDYVMRVFAQWKSNAATTHG